MINYVEEKFVENKFEQLIEHVNVLNDVEKVENSVEAMPTHKLESKQLPSHLRYAFLEDLSIFFVIIFTHLSAE